MNSSKFKGFEWWQRKRNILDKDSSYVNYSVFQLSQLCSEINFAKKGKKFNERKNSVYIPFIEKFDVVESIEEITKKNHQNLMVA